MITLHSITLKWHNTYKRWYCYTDTGLLIYIDLSLCPDSDNIESGHVYDLRGKLIPPPRYTDGGPIASLMVLAYAKKDTVTA